MTPAASLGAVLELLRALNWMIRAEVPWPTKRGQNFDFVLVGEPGVFALWVYDGDPTGIEEAAAGLGALLDGVRVRPVVCRGFASLGHAHPEVLYCTPETALDLLIGLPTHENQGAIRAIANRLRDLEVPIPPDPEPEPEPEPMPPPRVVVVESPLPEPRKVEPPKAASKAAAPAPSVASAPAMRPKVVKTTPPQADPVPKPEPLPPAAKAAPVPAEPTRAPMPVVQTTAPVVVAPVPEATPVPEAKPEQSRPLAAGRHRSERPRFSRRTPPPPPADARLDPMAPKSTLELPTALVAVRGRPRGGNDAAARFDSTYVYVPETVAGPGPLKREFRAKPFLTGIVVLIAIVVATGFGVKAWPQLAGLVKSDSNPSAAFGQTITTSTTIFHPNLRMSVTLPQRIRTSRGTDAYAIDFSVSNVGSTAWPLPARSAFTLIDSLGESRPLASISGVASTKWAGSLRPAQSWSGRLVFQLLSGRTPLRLRFALAANGSDTATWHN